MYKDGIEIFPYLPKSYISYITLIYLFVYVGIVSPYLILFPILKEKNVQEAIHERYISNKLAHFWRKKKNFNLGYAPLYKSILLLRQ